MQRRLAALVFVAGAFLIASCSGSRETPTSPSATPSPEASPSSTGSSLSGMSAPVTSSRGSGPFQLLPGLPIESVVVFPPRNESFDFGQALNIIYRDQLRRSPV